MSDSGVLASDRYKTWNGDCDCDAGYVTLALAGIVLLWYCGVFDVLGDSAGTLNQLKASLMGPQR